jgi:hypothetical protein
VAQRPERDLVDRIREAARTDSYWVLAPLADGRWTLRRFDDRTGLLGAAEHTSTPIGTERVAGVEWASGHVDVDRWQEMHAPHDGVFIDHLYGLVRELGRQPRTGRDIVVRIETDPSVPGIPLVVVRERWTHSDLESDPLYVGEHSEFEGDMLGQIADWFGLTGDRWTTVGPGEFRHE